MQDLPVLARDNTLPPILIISPTQSSESYCNDSALLDLRNEGHMTYREKPNDSHGRLSFNMYPRTRFLPTRG